MKKLYLDEALAGIPFNLSDLTESWKMDDKGDFYTTDHEDYAWMGLYREAVKWFESEDNTEYNDTDINEYNDYIYLYENE